jgi:hypothetical protein
MDIKELKVPNNVKYKRIIWGRSVAQEEQINLNEPLYCGSIPTIIQDLEEVNIFPAIIIYENTIGERKYIEITNKRTNQSNRK